MKDTKYSDQDTHQNQTEVERTINDSLSMYF